MGKKAVSAVTSQGDSLRRIRPDVIASSNWWDWGKKGTMFLDIAVKEMRSFPQGNLEPGETCWKLEQGWFWIGDQARAKSVKNIVGLMTTARDRNSNFLLNVGPDRNGKIIESSITALAEVGKLCRSDANPDARQ